MRYLSVCSGIEAATVAWHDLGFEAAAFSEIEKFPMKLLQHHYPNTPLHGDFTTIGENDYGAIDILVGGTPCQSFSIAGLRNGFSDERGNLALEFLQLAKRKKPKWIIWENVPGVLSSNGGKDFESFLQGLGECGYGFAYRILDAQYFGVAQQRRRLFVIGCLGDWQSAAKVLFEQESLQRNIKTHRKTRKNIADSIAKCLTKCGAGGGNHDPQTANYITTYGIQGNIIGRKPENGGNGAGFSEEISGTLTKTDRHAICNNQVVRRLTPLECERLMGFPDNYTNISGASDSNRYAALGNSMAVPVMKWIGQRIKLVDKL